MHISSRIKQIRFTFMFTVDFVVKQAVHDEKKFITETMQALYVKRQKRQRESYTSRAKIHEHGIAIQKKRHSHTHCPD